MKYLKNIAKQYFLEFYWKTSRIVRALFVIQYPLMLQPLEEGR